MKFCTKCGEVATLLYLCRRCNRIRIQKEEYIIENINKILHFNSALNLCQTLNRYTDDCDEDEVFGYALFGKKDKENGVNDYGIVVTKDNDIDENEWTMIMCNAMFHMKEDEIGLKVKIHKEE